MSSFQTRNQHNQNIFTMGLIYQSNVEMSAGLSAEIILRQASHVIHETAMYAANPIVRMIVC